MPDNDSFPVPGGASPDELRANPTVAERAAMLRRTLGYDPLDDEVIERAARRSSHWSRVISRQVAVAALSGAVTVLLVTHHLVGVTGQRPIDGEDFELFLVLTVVLSLLCSLSIAKIVIVARRRDAELGDFIAAHRELDELYRRENG
ncbi:hypothetical protein [Haloechinothrix sp. LS1_15]|uniref:hypothetical protein n=1 Tax=Haloechinothrix sp. LS1_15 TaxID=2652248 RepID=UPI0029451047|nr:hypothetical protein [Haloechinothrix sp. LS1_15]MDV6012340.1 hypothetical protein [Haloechinothrix sp. LS1_15]